MAMILYDKNGVPRKFSHAVDAKSALSSGGYSRENPKEKAIEIKKEPKTKIAEEFDIPSVNEEESQDTSSSEVSDNPEGDVPAFNKLEVDKAEPDSVEYGSTKSGSAKSGRSKKKKE